MLTRRLTAALALLCAVFCADGSRAQVPKSTLNSQVGQQFPDQLTGAITPATTRTFLNGMIASFQQYAGVNPQVGTTYTIAATDYGQLVTFSNTNPVAVSLPQAAGSFATFSFYAENKNTGTVTLTPTGGSTIDGAASFALNQNQSVFIVSDGTNWQVSRGFGTGTINSVALAMPGCFTVAGSPVTNSSGTFTVTMNGTSGGLPYFNSATTCASSGALTLNGMVYGGGAGGSPASTAAATNGQLWVGQTGAAPVPTTMSGDVSSITAGGLLTLGKVNGVTFPSSYTSGGIPYASGTGAISSSALLAANGFVVGGGAGLAPSTVNITGLVLGAGASAPGAYAGTSCTNQFPRSLNASGAATCASVANTDLANSTITLNAGASVGLTTPGAMSLGSTYTIGAITDVPRFAGINVPIIKPNADSTTAVQVTKADGTTRVVDVDTTNARVGINKTPGAFDLDTNGALNVGTTLTFTTLSATSLGASTSTITGLTVNNSPSSSNDYFLYYSAADGAIRKCTVGSCSSAAAAGVSSLNGLTGGLSIANGGGLSVSAASTTVTITAPIAMPQGRLTLVTNTPVMSSNQTAKSTLYYDCYAGNGVPYYNGSADQIDTIASCEVSTAMVSAASAGQVVLGQLYDLWWVHGGANRVCLAMSAAAGGGGGWASDTGGSSTARGTGYSQLDLTSRPYATNKNSITNCFNGATNYGPVSANQGTYLGTIYATANGQTGMAYTASAAGGGNNILGVYNAYNQVLTSGLSQDTTASWNDTTSTWKVQDIGATGSGLNNRITIVDGLGRATVVGKLWNTGGPPTGNSGVSIGINRDATTGGPTIVTNWYGASGAGPENDVAATNVADFLPSIGLHYFQAMQKATNASSVNMYGVLSGDNIQGIMIELMM